MHGKVGYGKERMCSYKHTHNSAVHITSTDRSTGNVIIRQANFGQRVPATTGGLYNVGFVMELFDDKNRTNQLGFWLKKPNNPKSGFRIFDSQGFTLDITNSTSGTFTVPVLPNSPFNQNAVPLFNDGLFRTEGSNFGFGVNRAGAKGIDNNSQASDQMFFRLLEFVIETSTGINLSDDNSQD